MLNDIRKIYQFVSQWGGWASQTWPVWTLVLSIWAAYSTLESHWTALAQVINGLPALIAGMPAYTEIMQANRVYPIAEHLLWIGFLLGVKILAFTYRAVKNHIPGLAS